MKPILTLVVIASLIQFTSAQTPANPQGNSPAPSPQQQAESYYKKGQEAETAGDPEAATLAYSAAIKANPDHANARYRLGQVKINAPNIAAKGREAKFGSVIIPEFNITDATLVESLEFLRTSVDKQSQGKVAANFVVQDPKNQISAVKINLKLKSMPARAIMKYLMDQSGAKARYDEFAIVVTPQ